MLVMKKENLALFNEILNMMRNDDYIINNPINPGFLDKITHKQKENDVLSPELETITNDIRLFLTAQPDYVDFLNTMDGFAYNGLILYSFSIKSEDGSAPSNNIFLNNDNFRYNDIYVSPCLAKNIVIGQDSISFFTYDLKENKYQIRDNVAIETVYDTFDNFADFLAELLDTVK
jgi:hypothetical protein